MIDYVALHVAGTYLLQALRVLLSMPPPPQSLQYVLEQCHHSELYLQIENFMDEAYILLDDFQDKTVFVSLIPAVFVNWLNIIYISFHIILFFRINSLDY